MNLPLDLQTIVLLALGIAILVTGLLVIRSGRAAERPSPRPFPYVGLGDNEKAGAPAPDRELAQRESQMRETINRLVDQLESKSASLKKLIREADRAVVRLEKAVAARQREEYSDDRTLELPQMTDRSDEPDPMPPGPHRVSAADIRDLLADNSRSVVGRKPDARQRHHAAARQQDAADPKGETEPLHAVEPRRSPESLRTKRPAKAVLPEKGKAASAKSSTRPASDQPEPAHRFHEIYLLADYGYPPEQIAERANMPVGEVELILSLRGDR